MALNTDGYLPTEEKLNIYTHAFGAVASVFGLILFLTKTIFGSIEMLSTSVFAISMTLLYLASTFYHAAKDLKKRKRLKILDHIAIYYLIAGTYTPFVLLVLKGDLGWTIFIIVWSIAAIGTILKLRFTGRFKLVSTLLYVGMGWIIIFVINPLIENFTTEGLYWLMAGGVAYTLGALLYMLKKISYTHATFHVMVLTGSFCHYYSIYCYVL